MPVPDRAHDDDVSDVVYLAEGEDKYTLVQTKEPIDCDARLPLCRAACCRLRVPLSRQDVDEEIAQWDPDKPFLLRLRDDGYCVHCDASSHRCTIYEQRPGICRTYTCRTDKRIWIDFEGRIPNPALVGLFPDAAPG